MAMHRMLSLVRVLGVGLVVACGDGGEDAEGLAGGEGGAGRGAGSGAGGAGTSASAGRGGQGDDAAGAGASSGSGRGDDAGTDAGLDAGAATDGSTSGGSAAPPVDDGSICTRDGACEQEVELAAACRSPGGLPAAATLVSPDVASAFITPTTWPWFMISLGLGLLYSSSSRRAQAALASFTSLR
jgi:hypothetical protein